MNEQTKKTESTEREAKTTELSEQDLEQAAGGVATPQDNAAHKGAQAILKYGGTT
jgi:hypothetical protein